MYVCAILFQTLKTRKLNALNLVEVLTTLKKPAVNKSSLIKLTFIGCSGSNYSAFYLYTATSVGFISCPLLCTCTGIREMWLMYGKVRTLQHIQYIHFLLLEFLSSKYVIKLNDDTHFIWTSFVFQFAVVPLMGSILGLRKVSQFKD